MLFEDTWLSCLDAKIEKHSEALFTQTWLFLQRKSISL